MPSYKGVCDHKDFGCFQLLSDEFHYSEIICFEKYKPIFLNFFCSFLSKCYQALLRSGPISFLAKYGLVCLFSDAIFTLLINFKKQTLTLDVINVCFCLILLFVLTCVPNNG